MEFKQIEIWKPTDAYDPEYRYCSSLVYICLLDGSIGW